MSFVPWQVWAGGAAIALACLFWWWLTRTLKKQGATERDLELSRANEAVKDRQLQAAQDRPNTREELIERLREKGL